MGRAGRQAGRPLCVAPQHGPLMTCICNLCATSTHTLIRPHLRHCPAAGQRLQLGLDGVTLACSSRRRWEWRLSGVLVWQGELRAVRPLSPPHNSAHRSASPSQGKLTAHDVQLEDLGLHFKGLEQGLGLRGRGGRRWCVRCAHRGLCLRTHRAGRQSSSSLSQPPPHTSEQYGQYSLENTATLLSATVLWMRLSGLACVRGMRLGTCVFHAVLAWAQGAPTCPCSQWDRMRAAHARTAWAQWARANGKRVAHLAARVSADAG